MRKSKLRDKLKKILQVKKPKRPASYYLLIGVLIWAYVGPLFRFITAIQIGMMVPDINSSVMDKVFSNASAKLAEGYLGVYRTMLEAGQEIGKANPTLAIVIADYIGYLMICCISVVIIYCGFNLLRILIIKIRKAKKEK